MIRYWFIGLMILSTISDVWARDCSKYGTRRILLYDNVVTITKPPAILDSVYNYWKYFQTAAGVKEVLDNLDSNQSCCNVLSVAKFTIPDDTVTSDLEYGLSRVAAPPKDTVHSADYILYGTVTAGDVPLYVLRLECAQSRALVKADSQILCYSFNPPGIGRTAASNLGAIYDTVIAFENRSRVNLNYYIPDASFGFDVRISQRNTSMTTIVIEYHSSVRSPVIFVMQNLSGKEIARFTTGAVQPENKCANWNIPRIPAGLYLFKMKAGNRVGIHKVALR